MIVRGHHSRGTSCCCCVTPFPPPIASSKGPRQRRNHTVRNRLSARTAVLDIADIHTVHAAVVLLTRSKRHILLSVSANLSDSSENPAHFSRSRQGKWRPLSGIRHPEDSFVKVFTRPEPAPRTKRSFRGSRICARRDRSVREPVRRHRALEALRVRIVGTGAARRLEPSLRVPLAV